MKTPIAILISDIHLREKRPKSRKDDFWGAQWDKIAHLASLQERYQCPILCGGDLFHHWKPSPELLSKAITNLPFMYTIPGQHDIPNHNLELMYKSGMATLESAGVLCVVRDSLWIDNNIVIIPFAWSQEISECNMQGDEYRDTHQVAMIHQLITSSKQDKLNKFAGGTASSSILKKALGFDLVLSGDNHKTFHTRFSNRTLVNPGSMMRNNIDQKDHKPCVYLWDGENVERSYFPIGDDVFDYDLKKEEDQKNQRIEAFVESLKMEYTAELSFENNLRAHIKENQVSKDVEELIWKCAS